MTNSIKKALSTKSVKTLVAGLGNTLLSDEGSGVKIIEILEKKKSIPVNFHLLDGGTAGYTLIDCMKDFDRVILIDAVRGGDKPGTIYHLSFEDIMKRPELKLSGHQIDLPEVLLLAKKLGELPQVLLIGIEPENIGYGMELSQSIKLAIDKVVKEICSLI